MKPPTESVWSLVSWIMSFIGSNTVNRNHLKLFKRSKEEKKKKEEICGKSGGKALKQWIRKSIRLNYEF